MLSSKLLFSNLVLKLRHQKLQPSSNCYPLPAGFQPSMLFVKESFKLFLQLYNSHSMWPIRCIGHASLRKWFSTLAFEAANVREWEEANIWLRSALGVRVCYTATSSSFPRASTTLNRVAIRYSGLQLSVPCPSHSLEGVRECLCSTTVPRVGNLTRGSHASD